MMIKSWPTECSMKRALALHYPSDCCPSLAEAAQYREPYNFVCFQVAVPRKTNPKLVMRTKKIFVGGLSATTSLEDVKVD